MVTLNSAYLSENIGSDHAEDIVNLDLNERGIARIDNYTFRQFTHLTELNLSGNEIARVDQLGFKDLQHLTRLQLDHNQLTEITTWMFLDMKKLTELDLSHNRIGKIAGNAFQGLDELLVLNLDANCLSRVSAAMFGSGGGLRKLVELSLASNQIGEKLAGDVFKGLGEIETIRLDGNKLARIEPDTFADQTRARLISLENNPGSFTSLVKERSKQGDYKSATNDIDQFLKQFSSDS